MSLLAVLAEGIRFAVGAVFALSTFMKLLNPRVFLEGVARYQILPATLARPAAVGVISGEGLVALSLLTGAVVWLGGLIAALLLLSFALAVTVNLRRGHEVPCYCFGARSEDPISARSLTRIAIRLS